MFCEMSRCSSSVQDYKCMLFTILSECKLFLILISDRDKMNVKHIIYHLPYASGNVNQLN